MTHTEAEVSNRLQAVLYGFPRDLLAPATLDRLARLCADLDAMGRVDPDTDDPMVDEHTLRTLLLSAVDRRSADHIVAVLASLPGNALRRPGPDEHALDEVGWFGLAANVGVYDTEPATTFERLTVGRRGTTADVVDAVNLEFPSLEKELLDPARLPRRVTGLVADGTFDTALREITRQLGWWAALVSVVMVPFATIATTPVSGERSEADHANAWPFGMFLLASAVGGWTLTVVGSCILAPLD